MTAFLIYLLGLFGALYQYEGVTRPDWKDRDEVILAGIISLFWPLYGLLGFMVYCNRTIKWAFNVLKI